MGDSATPSHVIAVRPEPDLQPLMSTPAGITFLHRVENAPRALRALRRVLLRPTREPHTTIQVVGVGAVKMPYRTEPDADGRRVDRLEPGDDVTAPVILPCRTSAGPEAPRHPCFAAGDRGDWEERRRPRGIYTLLPVYLSFTRGREWFCVEAHDENDRGFALFRFPAASRLTWAFQQAGGELAFCWSCADACEFVGVGLGTPLPHAQRKQYDPYGRDRGDEPITDAFDAEGRPIDLGGGWNELAPDELAHRLHDALE